MSNKAILAILDGWGLGTNPSISAIDQAKTPNMDSFYKKFPHTKLEASGLAVGLPEGQMGNSKLVCPTSEFPIWGQVEWYIKT